MHYFRGEEDPIHGGRLLFHNDTNPVRFLDGRSKDPFVFYADNDGTPWRLAPDAPSHPLSPSLLVPGRRRLRPIITLYIIATCLHLTRAFTFITTRVLRCCLPWMGKGKGRNGQNETSMALLSAILGHEYLLDGRAGSGDLAVGGGKVWFAAAGKQGRSRRYLTFLTLNSARARERQENSRSIALYRAAATMRRNIAYRVLSSSPPRFVISRTSSSRQI